MTYARVDSLQDVKSVILAVRAPAPPRVSIDLANPDLFQSHRGCAAVSVLVGVAIVELADLGILQPGGAKGAREIGFRRLEKRRVAFELLPNRIELRTFHERTPFVRSLTASYR